MSWYNSDPTYSVRTPSPTTAGKALPPGPIGHGNVGSKIRRQKSIPYSPQSSGTPSQSSRTATRRLPAPLRPSPPACHFLAPSVPHRKHGAQRDGKHSDRYGDMGAPEPASHASSGWLNWDAPQALENQNQQHNETHTHTAKHNQQHTTTTTNPSTKHLLTVRHCRDRTDVPCVQRLVELGRSWKTLRKPKSTTQRETHTHTAKHTNNTQQQQPIHQQNIAYLIHDLDQLTSHAFSGWLNWDASKNTGNQNQQLA